MRIIIAFTLLAFASSVSAEEIKIVSWNVEHGNFPDSDLETVAGQMTTIEGVDLWGISEANHDWGNRLRAAAHSGARSSNRSPARPTETARFLSVRDVHTQTWQFTIGGFHGEWRRSEDPN